METLYPIVQPALCPETLVLFHFPELAWVSGNGRNRAQFWRPARIFGGTLKKSEGFSGPENIASGLLCCFPGFFFLVMRNRLQHSPVEFHSYFSP